MNLNYLLILFGSIIVLFGLTEYSNSFNYMMAIILFILTSSLIYKKINKVNQVTENNTIDLTNINPNTNIEELNGLTVYADYNNSEDKKFFPMFINPLDAKKISPTNSVHLIVPGLMPASNKKWIDYNQYQIFYMPNDLKPHFHGEAMHHKDNKGFQVKKVFLLSTNDFTDVKNKQLQEYRDNLDDFNNGKSSTPIETWIHWMIPYNSQDYPDLIIKKNSVLWWDFNQYHNLNIVSEESYNNNVANGSNDKLLKLNNNNLQIIVTIMDKVGTFYFLCSIYGHASMGHKIKISVIE